MRWVVLAALVAAPAAHAASVTPYGATTANGQTVCSQVGNTVTCNSAATVNPPRNPLESFDRGYAIGAAIAQRRANQAAAQQAQQDADQRQIILDRVSSMVSAGDCEGAKKLALAASDMNLAEQAMRLCTPR